MTVGYGEPLVDEEMSKAPGTVNAALQELLRYKEILGAIAVSVDGLVIGSAGVEEEDADFLAVLGSSLVGVAERSIRRIDAGSAVSMSIVASDGMLTVCNGGSFARVILSEQGDSALVVSASHTTMTAMESILSPV